MTVVRLFVKDLIINLGFLNDFVILLYYLYTLVFVSVFCWVYQKQNENDNDMQHP